jgi:hypothetical protein
MQSNANYPNNLVEKMSKIQYSIRKTKEILESIEEIQKRLLRVAPIMRFKEHDRFFKDQKIRLFTDTIRIFRNQLEGLQKVSH